MSQDPVERFFGEVRQVGCQNDHPNMPTLLQSVPAAAAHTIIHRIQGLLKVTKRDKHSLLWSSENAYTGKSRRVSGQAEVVDCSIYYITGYPAQRLKKLTSCVTYFSTLYTGQLEAPVANLTACKEPLDPPQYVTARPSASHRGYVRDHRQEHGVYGGTIDLVIEECLLYFH